MKMLPSHIWNNSPHKKGESQVFALLSAINLSNFCVALHTQNIHGGKKQAWHELDFLVLTERAILGVEVKAARAVCVDGVWFFYNKDILQGQNPNTLVGKMINVLYTIQKDTYKGNTSITLVIRDLTEA